jgi:hypothetical protein
MKLGTLFAIVVAAALATPFDAGSQAKDPAASRPGAAADRATTPAPGSSSAGASSDTVPGSAAMFNRLDTNSDGSISREEANAAPAIVIIFTDVDTNSDGSLSKGEWSSYKWPSSPDPAGSSSGATAK